MSIFRTGLLAGALAACPALAFAEDALGPDFSIYGGYGLANIKADELVYYGRSKLSELNWESKWVSIFTLGLEAELDKDWTIRGDLDIGTGGDGHMVDYDWLVVPDEWSDRSIHPDTRLDHYFSANIQIDREVFKDDASAVSIGAGFTYSDVKWTAYGGSYIYSYNGFRDDVGNFPDGEKGISYQQKVPVGYLAVSGEHKVGQFTFSGGLRGGVSFGIEDIDDHWARDLRFYDSMDMAPMLGASITANYALTQSASLYLTGSWDKVFHSYGDVKIVDTTGGSADLYFEDGAGATFETISISFGLKGTF
ncbi:omptin family outer membrane protease [Ciceribacter sp. L1K22]|uniref:omptin family outer membrane protease n=1 Tax=Ciceribacter sp. L1K22 TaxID=2820275 RepID=UPI001ABDDC72|nr:omptin family outer membrane protease [Ciceribacter sp. L1K22]MBO3759728.1 omptin family outer membrane protease [Ciceribacter sp. L1K22]